MFSKLGTTEKWDLLKAAGAVPDQTFGGVSSTDGKVSVVSSQCRLKTLGKAALGRGTRLMLVLPSGRVRDGGPAGLLFFLH